MISNELVRAGADVGGFPLEGVGGPWNWSGALRGDAQSGRGWYGGLLVPRLRTGGRPRYDKSAAQHEARGARSTCCDIKVRQTNLISVLKFEY